MSATTAPGSGARFILQFPIDQHINDETDTVG